MESKKSKNVTVLISGDSNLGKSTVAFLVAQQIRLELSVDCYLIKGFNILSDEMQYHPIIGHYSPTYECPIILLLDEFDIGIRCADAFDKQNGINAPNNGQKDNLAIASNKINLNNFLDSINEESFLITVATTNTKLNIMNDDYGIYCRKGRFDKHFEMISKDTTNSFDPKI